MRSTSLQSPELDRGLVLVVPAFHFTRCMTPGFFSGSLPDKTKICGPLVAQTPVSAST